MSPSAWAERLDAVEAEAPTPSPACSGTEVSPALILYRLLTRMLEPLAPRLLDGRAKTGQGRPGSRR
jgi:hypothetical protein